MWNVMTSFSSLIEMQIRVGNISNEWIKFCYLSEYEAVATLKKRKKGDAIEIKVNKT